MASNSRRILFALLVCAASGLIFGLVRSTRPGYGLLDLAQGKAPEKEAFTAAAGPALNDSDVAGLARLDDEYAKLCAAVLPSVVSINTTAIVRQFVRVGPFNLPQNQEQKGLGSGAFISKEGHIITNFHVINGAQEVHVTTNDNKTYKARVIDASETRDIALIKLESDRKDFPALSFADSDKVRVGQIVFAVGNPFGLTGTVTQGIISARDRLLSEGQADYLQTDTVINPGNSGGPLVNIHGQIVGINVAIFQGDKRSQVWQGVGLAVPGNEAKQVIDSILALGTGKRQAAGYLGVSWLENPIQTPIGMGAMVRYVDPDSPAAVAGLLPGDIILDLNGQPITTPKEVFKTFSKMAPGTKFKVKVLRNGEIGIADGVIGAPPTA